MILISSENTNEYNKHKNIEKILFKCSYHRHFTVFIAKKRIKNTVAEHYFYSFVNGPVT